MKPKKQYVLIVSETFAKTHARSGEQTGFVNAILEGRKVHTMRGSYHLWKKRIAKINAGNGVLSVRVWTGLPYKSEQREVCRLDRVGLECAQWTGAYFTVGGLIINSKKLAENDGLSLVDFWEWFRGKLDNKPTAIIHFTDFRYNEKGHSENVSF